MANKMSFSIILMANTALSNLLGGNWSCISLLGPRLNGINCKSHKVELKSSRNYSTNHAKSKHATSYCIYSLRSIHTQACTYPDESDLKKPGMHKPWRHAPATDPCTPGLKPKIIVHFENSFYYVYHFLF